MTLDVIVPTFNRSGLLELCLRSLLDAPAPAGLEVSIRVIDNNSVDNTRAVVERLQKDASRPLHYLFQPVPGLSNSRNAGIEASSAELLGFIDDDEQIGPKWLKAIAEEFAEKTTDYLSGPCLAGATVVLPEWTPVGYHGILGITPVRVRQPMGEGFAGNLMGGNAVLRRAVFARVGLYDPHLGRSASGLQSDEDVDLYRRIKAAGLRGFYSPDLAILHHVPPERLTRSYCRQWCYGRGISQGRAGRRQPEAVPAVLGVPRYRLREGLAGLLALPRNLGKRGSGQMFARELPFWTLLGFLRGRFGSGMSSRGKK